MLSQVNKHTVLSLSVFILITMCYYIIFADLWTLFFGIYPAKIHVLTHIQSQQQKKIDRYLHAAAAGNIRTVVRILDEGLDVNAISCRGVRHLFSRSQLQDRIVCCIIINFRERNKTFVLILCYYYFLCRTVVLLCIKQQVVVTAT